MDQLGRRALSVNAGLESAQWMRTVRCPGREVALMTRSLAVMLASGIPLLRALESLTEQSRHVNLVEVLWSVSELISRGTPLSQALSRFPRVFPAVYVTMVALGERTGGLVEALARLADWLERDQAQRQKLLSALTYPALVLLVTSLLGLAMFTRVLGPFLESMTGMGVPLPWPTLLLRQLWMLAVTPGFWLVALGALGLGGVAVARRLAQPATQEALAGLVARLPGLGPLWTYVSLVRYLVAAHTMLHAGADFRQIWRLAAQASGHPLLLRDAPALLRRVEEGGSLWQHMRGQRTLYPSLMTQLIRAGEETGQLERMVRHLVRIYEEEVSHRLEVAGQLLEPLLLLFVASVCAFTLLSVLMPLYSYLTVL